MNKKGFTLVEVLVVIVLLGLIISIGVLGITRASKNAKKKSLSAKIKNIEKTAVLYSYDEHGNKSFTSHSTGYCNGITDCYYYNSIITVNDLLNDGYLKEDELDGSTKIVTDPTRTYNNLNKCEIQIYKKYNKIYAVLDRDSCNE